MASTEKSNGTTISMSKEKNKVTMQIQDGNSNNQGSSISTAIFHMLALSIGPTVFIVPSAFSMVGYIPAIIGIVTIGLFYVYNVQILLNSAAILCQRKSKTALSYAEVVKYAFEYAPRKVQFMTVYIYTTMNILFILSWAGELAFSVVFISKNIKYIIDWHCTFNTDIRLIVALLFIPCTLITLAPELKMTLLSLIATIIDILFIAIVLWISFTDQYPQFVNFEAIKTVYDIPGFLATIFFTLNFTGIALTLKYDMKKPEKFDSKCGAFNQAMFVIITINILFGFFGYAIYGNNIKGTMTLNLPHDILTDFMIATYCIAIFLTYPVCYYVIFSIVWNEYMKNKASIRFYTVRVAINVVIFTVITIFPQLGLFTEICGLVCAVFDSIMIPSLVDVLLSLKTDNNFKAILIKNIFIFIFGVVLFICGVFQCINDIVTGDDT